jgi:uncharacterized membrane protein (Fun14 family)
VATATEKSLKINQKIMTAFTEFLTIVIIGAIIGFLRLKKGDDNPTILKKFGIGLLIGFFALWALNVLIYR